MAGSLPEALHELGCDVRIFMPLYRGVREKMPVLRPLGNSPRITVGPHDYQVFFWQGSTLSGIPVYFLEKDEFYDRSYLYGDPVRGDYEDNPERFITFSRAVRHVCEAAGWHPSIFHLHDWQTGPAAAYLRFNRPRDPRLAGSATVFTIHNIAYQGVFPAAFFPMLDLPPHTWSPRGIEYWGQCNLLKAGIVYSDFVTTVSPRYADEITTADFGFGLDGVLREREKDLKGILNGIDTKIWNPRTDAFLSKTYDENDLSGKKSCKLALLKRLEFAQDTFEFPLLGMIGRLAAQKGFDLLAQILPELMKLPVNLVILGTGDASIEQTIREKEKLFPNRLKFINSYDEQMAHMIEAGSDIFLMPSRYEPCGLNQMYSLRYATIPIVHATGGLDNSVTDILLCPESGTGFKFYKYEAQSFLEKIKSALELFSHSRKWEKMQKRAMAQDFSWTRSAKRYLAIYDQLLKQERTQQ